MKKLSCLSLFIVFFTLKSHAVQEFETVVKDIQFNSSSRIVIDKKEIEKSHAKTVTALLAQANISVTQSNFTPTTIYLRGGDSSHVLIMVDGVPFYDASTVQRTVNLNSLDVKAIQKIEVIKGSQSVLYGGQALSGVIKIETIPQDLKNAVYGVGQFGSRYQIGHAVGFTKNSGDQSAVVVRGSYSAKDSASPVLDSKQVYPTRLATGELGYINRNSPLNYLLKVQTSFDKTLIATTDMDYLAADADHFESSTYQLNYTGYFSIPASYFKPSFSVSQQQSARSYEQSAAAGGGLSTKRDYRGDLLALRYEMTLLDLNKYFNWRVGGNFSREKMVYNEKDVLKTDTSAEFEGVFFKARTEAIEHVIFEAGARADFKKMKNQMNTYQVGLTLFEEIKLEYSTGLKQPSLFQLFSDYGNPDLKPEKSISFSAAVDHKFSDSFFASYTYFETKFENLITTVGAAPPNIKYENVDDTKTKGHELALAYSDQARGTAYNLNLSYQEPKDGSQNTWLIRRPLRSASLKIRQEFDKLGLGSEFVHNGSRRDKTGQTSFATVPSYTLLHLIADYKYNEQVLLFSRVQNVANYHHETTYGFYDEGINALVGAQMDF